MKSVFKKELKAYFAGMTGWIVLAFLVLAAGFSSWLYNFYMAYATYETSLTLVVYVLLFVIPILTMRSLSEEKQRRTDQLLFTLPMKVSDIVIAKYFAMVTVFAIPCGVMCLIPLIMCLYGHVMLGVAYSAILAFFLLGCALIAVGMFMSSLTESQIIAAVLTFAVLLLFLLMPTLAGLLPQTALASYIAFTAVVLLLALLLYYLSKNYWASFFLAAILEIPLLILFVTKKEIFEGAFQKVLDWFSVFSRLDSFLGYGLFDLTALVYFISIACAFVFFTVQSVEKKRYA
ncbi:MAG: ABC transporter permease [Lachnospiraceae bacterium]|nr:ABC transporter permease [Lachnospiraceae bacterium]